MDKAVLLPYGFQYAFLFSQFRFAYGLPFRVFKVASPEVRKFHQVLVVVVFSTADNCVITVQFQFVEHAFSQVVGHGCIIDDAQRFSAFAAFHAFRYALEHSAVDVAVDFHLGIAGEFEGIGFESGKSQSTED